MNNLILSKCQWCRNSWMLHGTMVSSSDRFRKHYKIVHCLPLCTSNIVWVGDDTIDRALRHNCVISTTIHVTQTADQITSPNKPNRNHNHNAQPPTQTHIPEVCFRVTLPTMWNQLAEFWQSSSKRFTDAEMSQTTGATQENRKVLTLTQTERLLWYLLYFSCRLHISASF